ncbi:MAG: sulfatase-like hydrolase/transferase [Sporocytophaga sp.]|uniref:sulfatase-like hydrolase/transferase n=1 Tax=Sporocytophaga sp. TaxID=2231183 RepID=UPI001B12A246|nr:sulfatase-like hydrolase/transferase [Sporocytophaga sp.]MBO9701036.1 sulfatase-like hydrolase/transferase [Sporocytophaga sp.]
MKKQILFSSMLLLGALASQGQQTQEWKGKVAKNASESLPYKLEFNKAAPEGAPNVVLILLDDVGYGAISTFGGLINTPNLDTLANNGLRYTNFHTTGICSPTRAALLTGRNHHSVGMGLFPPPFIYADFPGYNGYIQPENGTVAEVLQANGYSTYQVGKWHLTPGSEYSDLGPFLRWPSGKGFDHNLSFLGGATDQYKLDLVEDNQHVKTDGSHLNKLLTDKSISYITKQKAIAPNKPFFLYYATGAAHAPHQVAKEWSDKYKGKFDAGWDVYRETVFANQKKLGVIPANAKLPDRNSFLHAWKDLSPEEKKVNARFMEVYAGFLEYTDFEIGRLIAHLKTTGQFDNTAFFVIVGDNGASKEGTEYGVTTQNPNVTSGVTNALTREDYKKFIQSEYDKIGGKEVISSANYPLGWAQATNTPFKLWKQDANAEGGTHNPLIFSYSKAISEKGGIRNQYGHVIDIYPTILDLTGIQQPEKIKNINQKPLHGNSLAYAIKDKNAPSTHTQQYYTIFGNRAIVKDGWKASAAHHPNPLDLASYLGETKPVFVNNADNDVWELYNLNEDFNERNDLAKKYPEKLKELKALYDQEAEKYNIYPLIDIEYYIKQNIKTTAEQKK